MTRLERFVRAVQFASRSGTLRAQVRSRVQQQAARLRYLVQDPAASEGIALHCPDYVEPSQDPAERGLVERIIRSFTRMKADQRDAPTCYHPSSLWQRQLDESYASLAAGDPRTVHAFLANFGTWKTYHGLEPTTLLRAHRRSLTGRRYLADVLFRRPLQFWKAFFNGRRPLARLTYPRHGNQAGAFIGPLFVGAGSFSNDIYGSLLNGLIRDRARPVVAELGAGYGKLAYFTLRDLEAFTYIDVDLPETVCLAAYYLMKAWPEKRALLYGEAPYTPEAHSRYDLIFLPSYAIERAAPASVDLFINKDSLGEMTREAVTRYVGAMTRAARYFFHINHDRDLPLLAPHEQGLLASDYPVPEAFRLLFRAPDMSHSISNGGADIRLDRFVYLYERKGSAEAGTAAEPLFAQEAGAP